MGIGFKYGGNDKKYKSKSGWERSWFGGYTQMIWDHPTLVIPYELRIEPSESLRKSLGHFAAEKLIKIFILQCKKNELIHALRVSTVTRKNLFGDEINYEQVFFDNRDIFNKVVENNGELAPLFEHYKEGILGSCGEREIIDDKGDKGDKGDKDNGDTDGETGGKTKSPRKIGDKESMESEKNIKEMLKKIKSQEYKNWKINVSGFEKNPVFKPFYRHAKGEKYQFIEEEIIASDHLVKLLDISFDPKSDVVKSLRLGKLDTSKIAEVPAGNLSVYKRIVEDQDTRPFSVCILADMSGSMVGDRLDTQFRVLNSLYLAMGQILPDDKLFIYGHTGQDVPEIYTFYSPYEQNYEENISKYYRITTQQNYDGPVIETIHKKIREFTEDRIIFICLSDGEPCGQGYGGKTDIDELKQILEKCRRDEFVTVGIGIQSNHVTGLYTYSKVVNELKNMAKNVSGIINSVILQEFK